ncbi:hypothetical protein ZIOFF_050589 [Zingiber officinale]|uniref:peptidylprolyl isomerase n=1 Tax=Zingiber officinale TaxID=94328 RepID=A0A8J5FRA4_ZINOF|nr:hypothetical protein ZIOFF_050589 [Zingiber officinale]
MQELEGIIQQRDRELRLPATLHFYNIEEDMVDGFPFEIPEEYSNLPLLKGKATVDIKNGFASLLELVLGDKTLTKSVSQHCESINTYIERILVIPVRPCHVDYRNNLTCHLQGATTTCYVALHPNLKGVNGKYFDEELLRRLWALNEKMIKANE